MSASEATPLPDRVVITAGNKARELKISDFLAMDLHAQVNHLFRGEVAFFLGREKLRTVDALKSIRTQRAQVANQATAP